MNPAAPVPICHEGQRERESNVPRAGPGLESQVEAGLDVKLHVPAHRGERPMC